MQKQCTILFSLLSVLVLGCVDDAAPSFESADQDLVDQFVPPSVEPDAESVPPEPQDMGLPLDAAPVPVPIARIETILADDETAAGTQTRVTCEVYDAEDQLIDGARTDVEIRPRVGWSLDEDSGDLFAQTAGQYSIRCGIPRFALFDETPATWTIIPGPVTRTAATATPSTIAAGESAAIACEATDVLGNTVDGSNLPRMTVGNFPGVNIDGDQLTATRAGAYQVYCSADGATQAPTRVEVVAGAPVRLVAALNPPAAVYRSGTIVSVDTQAVDEHDNQVAGANIQITSAPELPNFGVGRFQLVADGRYTLTSSLVNDAGDVVDSIDLPLIVDSGGPSISCDSPAPNAMVLTSGDVVISGSAIDTAAVGFVDVDGIPVPIADDGSFSASVRPEPGVNVHLISAADEFGNITEIFCPYFAADAYLAEDGTFADAIILDMGELAVDDGPPAQPLSSLTDLFRLVLSSDALVETLSEAATANNPILDQCLVDTFFGCLTRGRANLRSVQIRGGRDVSMRLFGDPGGDPGGFALTATFRDLRLNTDIRQPVSTDGYIEVSRLTVAASFRLTLGPDGLPAVSIVEGSQVIQLGNLSSDFGGVGGFFVDLFFPLIEGALRGQVSGTLQEFVFSEIDTLISGALAGLDLSAFGLGFDIVSPDGRPVRIALATATTTMNANSNRLRIGIGTRAEGAQANILPSAGVPIFGELNAIERDRQGNLGAIIHLGMINQIMHTLWRGDFFNLADAGALAGGEADGFNISFNLLVPPALRSAGNGEDAILSLGPAQASIQYPGLIDEPINLMVVANLRLGIGITPDGNLALGADGIEFEDLNLLIEDIAMDPQDRRAIEDTFGVLIGGLVDSALGGALPSLPVPEIPIPDDVAALGVDPGLSLGIREPAVELGPVRLFIDGNLGE